MLARDSNNQLRSFYQRTAMVSSHFFPRNAEARGLRSTFLLSSSQLKNFWPKQRFSGPDAPRLGLWWWWLWATVIGGHSNPSFSILRTTIWTGMYNGAYCSVYRLLPPSFCVASLLLHIAQALWQVCVILAVPAKYPLCDQLMRRYWNQPVEVMKFKVKACITFLPYARYCAVCASESACGPMWARGRSAAYVMSRKRIRKNVHGSRWEYRQNLSSAVLIIASWLSKIACTFRQGAMWMIRGPEKKRCGSFHFDAILLFNTMHFQFFSITVFRKK